MFCHNVHSWTPRFFSLFSLSLLIHVDFSNRLASSPQQCASKTKITITKNGPVKKARLLSLSFRLLVHSHSHFIKQPFLWIQSLDTNAIKWQNLSKNSFIKFRTTPNFVPCKIRDAESRGLKKITELSRFLLFMGPWTMSKYCLDYSQRLNCQWVQWRRIWLRT